MLHEKCCGNLSRRQTEEGICYMYINIKKMAAWIATKATTFRKMKRSTTLTRIQHVENVTHCTKRIVPLDLQTRPKCWGSLRLTRQITPENQAIIHYTCCLKYQNRCMMFYQQSIAKQKELMMFQTDYLKTATAFTTESWTVLNYALNIIVQSA